MDNEKINKRVVDATKRLIFRYGISSVTMDMIARTCGISKRTLYELFTDKNSLINDVLNYHYDVMQAQLYSVKEKAHNSLEAFLMALKIVHDTLNEMSAAFVEDVTKTFTPANEEYARYERQTITDLAQLITKGQEEGVMLPHYDPMLLAKMFVAPTFGLKQHFRVAGDFEETLKLLKTAEECYIRGIVTPQGLEIYESFNKEEQ